MSILLRQALAFPPTRMLPVLIALVSAMLLFGFAGSVSLPSFPIPEFGEGILLLWGLGHCDTLDGPVVKLARKALETGNANHVLSWVPVTDEAEIRRAFAHALAVRKLGPEAQDLADTHFFETLVRIHRAGEGATYMGLKPGGLDLGPAVPAADKALETGSIDSLVTMLTDAVRHGTQHHFQKAYQTRSFDVNDVSSGRRHVEAYVAFVHYVEELWETAHGDPHEHHRGQEHHHDAQ